MRGVYPSWSSAHWQRSGSSPLARGLLQALAEDDRERRIIPACAGFTPASGGAWWPTTDHPRLRGVYPGTRADCRRCPGIIPACAGFTTCRTSPECSLKDHPRLRGVYQAVMLVAPQWLGSSPLARGLPQAGMEAVAASRIIPACAGFTTCRAGRKSSRWDHPRLRGVYDGVKAILTSKDGSSPLARGLRARPGLRRRPGRIIPACAGFTRPL